LSCRASIHPISSYLFHSWELPSLEHGKWRNNSNLYIDGRRSRPSTSSVHPANVKRSKQPGSVSASSVGEPSTAGRISNCAAGCQLSGMTNYAVIPDVAGTLEADSHQQPPPPQPSQQPYPNPPGSAPAPVPPGEMVTLPPPQHQQQQDFYRHPPQYDMYPGHPQDPMRGPPPPHLYQSQPAPRQRTAIACRYCRRRKVSRRRSCQCRRVLTIDRSVVPGSMHQKTDVARIVNASSRNVSSHRSPHRRKPSYPRIRHTPI